MKRIFFLIALLLCAARIEAQGTVPITQTLFTGTISASSAACATANSCSWIKLQIDRGTTVVTIAGTFSATLVVEASADGGSTFTTFGTFTTVQTALPFSTAGFTDIRVRASSYVSGVAYATLSVGQAVTAGSGATGNIPGISDPCNSPGVLKSSVPIAITTAATTSLVAGVAGKSIYVCGFDLTISQVITTANIFTLEYGTQGGPCTTPTVLTGGYGTGGVLAAPPIFVVAGNGDSTLVTAPAGAQLCGLTTIGATGAFEGVLTYVQQ